MICRRKPLEFECWTWDGVSVGPLWVQLADVDFRPGDYVVRDRHGVRLLTPDSFAAEFDLVPEPPPKEPKCET